ncbi:MFS transporter [Klebsiella pneumoniae]|uniref:MFS transporter n=1 Tax=Klebsiella pneumoniae TaxID=573 RepID=A0A939NSP7_KLEPN|nr:MFS transporter [Klebsiella pneumoniae]
MRWCRSAALAVAAGKQQQRQSRRCANRRAFSLRTAAELLRMPRFWGFIVYVVGVASVYDVFDQQFANFFKSFSPVRSAVPKCLASSPPAASCSTR